MTLPYTLSRHSQQLQKVLPDGHPNVDDLFENHEDLPEWHIDLSLILVDNPIDPVYVFRFVARFSDSVLFRCS